MELTTEQKQEWEQWLSERPENVRKVAEKTFFGKIWDKLLWKDDPEAVNIIVVKVLG